MYKKKIGNFIDYLLNCKFIQFVGLALITFIICEGVFLWLNYIVWQFFHYDSYFAVKDALTFVSTFIAIARSLEMIYVL